MFGSDIININVLVIGDIGKVNFLTVFHVDGSLCLLGFLDLELLLVLFEGLGLDLFGFVGELLLLFLSLGLLLGGIFIGFIFFFFLLFVVGGGIV